MNKKINSLWQDYETHQFTCENCKTEFVGKPTQTSEASVRPVVYPYK